MNTYCSHVHAHVWAMIIMNMHVGAIISINIDVEALLAYECSHWENIKLS